MNKARNAPALVSAVYKLSVRELLRNKLGMALLVLIPCIFITIALATAGKGRIPIKLYLQDGVENLLLSQHDIMLVFITASVNGFLTAYFALLLFHRDFGYYRYCVFAGLPPMAFIAGRFAFFLTIAAMLAGMTTLINAHYVPLSRPVEVFCGYLFLGIIYGSFGSIVGSFSRDFLVAMLCIFLLTDLDAAWLQNPVYYSASQDTEFLRWLPAHFPTQLVFASAFTDKTNLRALAGSAGYMLFAFSLLLLLVGIRMSRVSPVNRSVRPGQEPKQERS